jgi:hypothetical protein
MDLVQMMRYGEIDQAVTAAGKELRLARKTSDEAGANDGKGEADSSGLIRVPSLKRTYELGYNPRPALVPDIHYQPSRGMRR